MKNKKQINWKAIIVLIVVMGILVLLIKPMINQFKTTGEDGRICYEKVCIKRNLDNFDNCIDIGRFEESFLSPQHFYICDGNRVPDKCLEWGEAITNQTYLRYGMRCEVE